MMEFIQTLALLSGLTVIVSEYLSKLTKVIGTWAKIQSWVVAIVLGFVANALGWGFGEVSLFTNILGGFVVGIFANGVFDLAIVQKFLALIKARYLA